MNIEEQTGVAKKITDDLLKFIIRSNRNVLNVDEKGCSIDSIHINYYIDRTVLTVKFKSNNSLDAPVTFFECQSIKY